MERPSFLKRRGDSMQQGDSKKTKTDGGPKMSFAERMMAKQGWKVGEGLGKEKSGIVEPISVKLRPMGAGIGTVKEKTTQQKEEEKRQAKRNGQEYDDSSEEERQSRRRRKEIKKAAGISSGTSTPLGGRSKQKFTIEDIPEGMEVPRSLLEFTDATGKEPKLLTTSTLSLGANVPAETSATKIARMARRELEAYASAFNDLVEEINTKDFEALSLRRELENIEIEIKRDEEIANAIGSLRHLQTWEDIIAKLEELQLDQLVDSSLAVAAIHPHFKDIMSSWEPLNDGLENIVADIQKIPALSTPPKVAGREESRRLRPQSTTPFETMIHTYFVPKMRSAIMNWDPYQESMRLIAVLAAWFPVLPKFVQNSLIKQVVTKLTTSIQAWNPRKSIKKKVTSQLPNLVTPWLPFLPRQHRDSQAATGLVSDVKRKFRTLVDAWDLSRGVIPEIENWRRLLGGEEFDRVLRSHLLPKLADTLRNEFEVMPGDQDLQPLLSVLEWKPMFTTKVMGELIAMEVMPKLMEILHRWLTDQPVHSEVAAWLEWFKSSVIPEDINAVSRVAKLWEELYRLFHAALDMGDRVKTDLRMPSIDERATESPRPSTPAIKEPPSAKKEMLDEPTFRDTVESWCNEENLLLLPLRKAHDITGSPLFRITASAAGQGGVVVYFKGDIMYAQSKKEKSLWEPVGLEEELVQRAEGK